MSFAEDVKNEIAHYETTDEGVRRAELAALLCIGGYCITRYRRLYGRIGIQHCQ